jgi:hypothetical protein
VSETLAPTVGEPGPSQAGSAGSIPAANSAEYARDIEISIVTISAIAEFYSLTELQALSLGLAIANLKDAK